MEQRQIEGASNYSVTKDGRVYSRISSAYLKTQWAKGYAQVFLSHDNGVKRWRKVHRLVLLAFVGLPEGDQIGLHGPKGSSCNDLSNLYWGTYSQNSKADRERDGTDINRSKNGRSKLTEEERWEIHQAKMELIHELAAKYGVSAITIGREMSKSSRGSYKRE
jgi:hypothetical protein